MQKKKHVNLERTAEKNLKKIFMSIAGHKKKSVVMYRDKKKLFYIF